MLSNFSVLTPAYGRDYSSQKQVIEDFEDNKDFVIQPQGFYINKEQIPVGLTVNIRYAKLRKVLPIKVK